jgi:hypothetical protein
MQTRITHLGLWIWKREHSLLCGPLSSWKKKEEGEDFSTVPDDIEIINGRFLLQ